MTHPAIDSIKRILALALLLSSTPAFAQNVTKLAPSLPGPPRLLPISDSRVAALVEKNKKFPTTKGFRDLSELYLALNRPGGKVARPTLVEAVTPTKGRIKTRLRARGAIAKRSARAIGALVEKARGVWEE